VITTLAFRHLLVRKLRSLFLLLGFSLGVGVMIVLLSVGEAMLEQSRDVSLVGGGEVTVLPLGIDIEAMRTGGIGSMFFGIDRARFLVRQVLGGSRNRDLVRTVSPDLENKLLYLKRGGQIVPIRAGGEIPSRAGAVGSGLKLISGDWNDSPADSAYLAPTAQQLYDELDRFHIPSVPDSSWGEWHYFNLVTSDTEWWYITYLVGGEVGRNLPAGRPARWGGQLLVTHRRAGGDYERFLLREPGSRVALDTVGADLKIGRSSVRQRDGVYHLVGRASGPAGPVRIDVELTPSPHRYFPPVELQDEAFVSGYVVPGLVATASGTVCVAVRCRAFHRVPAYHDHNWGVWRDVSWEWGAGQGIRFALLYGGVYGPNRNSAGSETAVRSPFFLTLVDSLGVRQVLRFDTIHYHGKRTMPGTGRFTAPEDFDLLAIRESDTLRLEVQVKDALATAMKSGGFRRGFLQMRGWFTLQGRVLGETVSDSGRGFFETYVSPR
jgi:hypothetical protein